MLLQVTAAGDAERTQARLLNKPLPKFTTLVLDGAATQADLRKPILQPLHESNAVALEPAGTDSFWIYGYFPPEKTGLIRGIALMSESGIIYAYGRYAEAQGGFTKTAGMLLRFRCLFSESSRTSLAFTYEVVDLETAIMNRLNTFFSGVLDRLAALEACCAQSSTQTGMEINAAGELVYTEDSAYSPLAGVTFSIQAGNLMATGEETLVNRLSINTAGELILTGDQ